MRPNVAAALMMVYMTWGLWFLLPVALLTGFPAFVLFPVYFFSLILGGKKVLVWLEDRVTV